MDHTGVIYDHDPGDEDDGEEKHAPTPTKLPCGCHCKGGCGDPYAACMWPCAEHIPL